MRILSILSLVFLIGCVGCKKNNGSITPTSGTINAGNDPNFKIVANNDGILNSLPKKVVVFDIPIYAASGVEDARLLHAANIMAQYLDNNEDGQVDNPRVVETMKTNKAFLLMWKTEADMPSSVPSGYTGQDLGNDETIPAWHTNGHTGRFDASLEEVLHIITHAGYSKAYPQIFGEQAGSSIANAMDQARGGRFTSIPASYPSGAWYTYDDATCNYDCMVTEYHYWALTSILGAQANRLAGIGQEWKLNTKAKVQAQDIAIYQLLTDPQYNFPTKLPDGTYRR
ncbi:MAG TPA: hypothetical protein DCS93_28795 [Microscillaceae bacterium]|nr:hypothetical protein [Microscillaceae bacterium]